MFIGSRLLGSGNWLKLKGLLILLSLLGLASSVERQKADSFLIAQLGSDISGRGLGHRRRLKAPPTYYSLLIVKR